MFKNTDLLCTFQGQGQVQGQVIFGVAFHKLKYEQSLKSLWQLDVKL